MKIYRHLIYLGRNYTSNCTRIFDIDWELKVDDDDIDKLLQSYIYPYLQSLVSSMSVVSSSLPVKLLFDYNCTHTNHWQYTINELELKKVGIDKMKPYIWLVYSRPQDLKNLCLYYFKNRKDAERYIDNKSSSVTSTYKYKLFYRNPFKKRENP